MDPTRTDLFHLAEQRLAWADQRQALLAQNIANASTPGYRPRDIRPFTDALARLGAVQPARTDPAHLAGTVDTTPGTVVATPKQKSPDGNAVTLDQELTRVADTQTTQATVTALYKRYVSMFQLALGRSS